MRYERLLQLGGIDRPISPIPPYISKQDLQKEIESLDATKLGIVDESLLFSSDISLEQKKQVSMMQILMLEQMYGYTNDTIENPEYDSVIIDSEEKIVAGNRRSGEVELFGVVY